MPCVSHDDLVEAVFHEGFSIKDEATELSGRGVGMGAVREACRALGGTLEIVSPVDANGGTELRFTLPDPAGPEPKALASIVPRRFLPIKVPA